MTYLSGKKFEIAFIYLLICAFLLHFIFLCRMYFDVLFLSLVLLVSNLSIFQRLLTKYSVIKFLCGKSVIGDMSCIPNTDFIHKWDNL